VIYIREKVSRKKSGVEWGGKKREEGNKRRRVLFGWGVGWGGSYYSLAKT